MAQILGNPTLLSIPKQFMRMLWSNAAAVVLSVAIFGNENSCFPIDGQWTAMKNVILEYNVSKVRASFHNSPPL
jgi:hypothetical protein